MKRMRSALTLTLLLTSMLVVAFDVQPVRSDYVTTTPIYLRADGSIDPPTAPISTVDNITYILGDNITFSTDIEGIVVEKSDIVIDGNQYSLDSVDYMWGNILHLLGVTNVTIQNLTIIDLLPGSGILVDHGSRNKITGNKLGGLNGISLESSSNNSIYGNIIASPGTCIWASQSSDNNEIYGNGLDADSIALEVWGSNNRIWNNSIFAASMGFFLYGSNNNVSGNDLMGMEGGVLIWGSENIISRNSISSYIAALSVGGPNNTISGNDIGHSGVGISSSNNSVSGNRIVTDDAFGISGSSNTISGNDIETGMGLFIAGPNNIISGNDIKTEILFGLSISSSNNTVSGNRIRNTSYPEGSLGISISSSNNMIAGNNITNFNRGISISGSDNHVLHNNFIGNGQLAAASGLPNFWDNGYPSGGNYWSDYPTRYPNATEIDSSGIWNMPYVVNASNTDNYPLMNPYVSRDIGITALSLSKTVVGQGNVVTIDVKAANHGANAEAFNIAVYANTSTIAEFAFSAIGAGSSVEILFNWSTVGFASGNYTVSAEATPVPGEIDTADNTYIYGTIAVTIQGDVDGDFNVDIFDVVAITSRYGESIPPIPPGSNNDVDGNGVVNIFDVVICTSHYGQKWP